MIKINKGIVETEGSKLDLLCDLTAFLKMMFKKEGLTFQELGMIVDAALKSDDQIKEEANKAIMQLAKKFHLSEKEIDLLNEKIFGKNNDKPDDNDRFNNIFGDLL